MFKLNIGKKCLDRVLSGEQKEVYVQDIPYNEEELVALWGKDTSGWKNPQRVTLTESEEEGARFALAVCTLAKGEGWPEWGAQKNVYYFILKIQKLEASCEVVAEEEKAEDPIAEVKVEEVPAPEKVEPVAEPESVAEPEEEKKTEVTVEDVKKAADELAKAAAEVTVATEEATKAVEKAGPVIAEAIAETKKASEEVKAGEEPIEEKKAEEKTETEAKKEKAEVNE